MTTIAQAQRLINGACKSVGIVCGGLRLSRGRPSKPLFGRAFEMQFVFETLVPATGFRVFRARVAGLEEGYQVALSRPTKPQEPLAFRKPLSRSF